MDALLELAMDLRWTWNHSSDELWRRLDPELWTLTHHPNVVLQTVARDKLASALADPDFCPATDFTARIVAHRNLVVQPSEAEWMLWQR